MVNILVILIILLSVFTTYYLLNRKISIFGYGSLMSIKSVKKTMPNACNFRSGILQNYMRIFSNELSEGLILSMKKANNKQIFVRGVIFDIPRFEYNNFVNREKTYKIRKINVIDYNNSYQQCYTCLEGDKTFRSNIYKEPSTDYLLFCLNILKNMPKKYKHNFLENTYLSDGKTTIHNYLMNTSNIELKEKYYNL
jgi:hypothetical protein